jgi:hypothetical protein
MTVLDFTRYVRFGVYALDSASETVSIGKYVNATDITDGFDCAPHAKLTFEDKGGYIENAIQYTSSFPIVVSASTNSGASWNRIFKGMVENVETAMDADGARKTIFRAYGAPTLRNTVVSPNQIGIGDCNFGELFTGSANLVYTTKNRTWTSSWEADERGNYPNGLLYDTGYTYSANSVVDFIPGVDDVPIKLGHGSDKLLDVIASILGAYGVNYRTDDLYSPPRFLVKSGSMYSDWPIDTTVAYRWKVGTNVNSFKRSYDLGDAADCVGVFGESPRHFFFAGEGGRQKNIIDNDIRSFEAAQQMAEKHAETLGKVPKAWEIVTTPQLTPSTILSGRSFYFIDSSNVTSTANMVGLTQRTTEDRWESRLFFEKRQLTEEKVFAEIKEELEDIEKKNSAEMAHVRVKTDTSSYFHEYQGYNDWRYPCAMGISSATASADDEFPMPIAIVPLAHTSENTGSIYYPTYSSFAFFDRADKIGLVKNITLFCNTESAPYHRSVTSSTWSDGWNSQSENILNGIFADNLWPMEITNVRFKSIYDGCSHHISTAMGATIRHVNWTMSNNSPTSSEWDEGYEPSAEELLFMSTNFATPTTHYKVCTFSADQDTVSAQRSMVRFTWDGPVSPTEFNEKLIWASNFTFKLRGEWSHPDVGTVSIPVGVYSAAGNDSTWYAHTAFSASDVTVATGYSIGKESYDESGRMHWMFSASSTYSSGTNKIVVGYASNAIDVTRVTDDLYYEDAGDVDYIVEKAAFDFENGALRLSFEPYTIGGVWLYGSENPTTGKTIPTGPNVYSFWKSLGISFVEKDKKVSPWMRTEQRRKRPSLWASLTSKPKSLLFPGFENVSVPASLPYNQREAMISNGGAYVSYSTRRGIDVQPGTEYDPADFGSISYKYNEADRADGSFSSYVVYEENAPADLCHIVLDFTCVGDTGGVLGSMNIAADSNSSLREGIDKNARKTLAVQYDIKAFDPDRQVYWPGTPTLTMRGIWVGFEPI